MTPNEYEEKVNELLDRVDVDTKTDALAKAAIYAFLFFVNVYRRK
jgi:hypothetical protein